MKLKIAQPFNLPVPSGILPNYFHLIYRYLYA
jgi:hypothetical protein